MEWKTFFATFSAIFIAELADKTQMVGLTLSAKSGKPYSVFLGSVTAFIVITALSVMAGALLGKYIKPDVIKYIGGTLFIIIGVLMVIGKI